MENKTPSERNSANDEVCRNGRLAARYKAHELLESAIFAFHALQREAQESADDESFHRVLGLDLDKKSALEPHTKCRDKESNSLQNRYFDAQAENEGFDPIAKLMRASLDVIDCATTCLRIFTDKKLSSGVCSKGMPSWEVLYSNSKKSFSNSVFSNDGAPNDSPETSRRLIAFFTFISKILCETFPLRLALCTAQLLQRYNDAEKASELAQASIAAFLDYEASTHTISGSTFGTQMKDDTAGEGVNRNEGKVRQIVQRTVFQGFPPTSASLLEGYGPPLSEITSLLALDAECIGQLHGIRKTLLSTIFSEKDSNSTEKEEPNATRKKKLESLFSCETLKQLLELEVKCTAEKERNEEWRKKQALSGENQIKENKLSPKEREESNGIEHRRHVSTDTKNNGTWTKNDTHASLPVNSDEKQKNAVLSLWERLTQLRYESAQGLFQKRNRVVLLIIAISIFLVPFFPFISQVVQNLFMRAFTVKKKRNFIL